MDKLSYEARFGVRALKNYPQNSHDLLWPHHASPAQGGVNHALNIHHRTPAPGERVRTCHRAQHHRRL